MISTSNSSSVTNHSSTDSSLCHKLNNRSINLKSSSIRCSYRNSNLIIPSLFKNLQNSSFKINFSSKNQFYLLICFLMLSSTNAMESLDDNTLDTKFKNEINEVFVHFRTFCKVRDKVVNRTINNKNKDIKEKYYRNFSTFGNELDQILYFCFQFIFFPSSPLDHMPENLDYYRSLVAGLLGDNNHTFDKENKLGYESIEENSDHFRYLYFRNKELMKKEVISNFVNGGVYYNYREFVFLRITGFKLLIEGFATSLETMHDDLKLLILIKDPRAIAIKVNEEVFKMDAKMVYFKQMFENFLKIPANENLMVKKDFLGQYSICLFKVDVSFYLQDPNKKIKYRENMINSLNEFIKFNEIENSLGSNKDFYYYLTKRIRKMIKRSHCHIVSEKDRSYIQEVLNKELGYMINQENDEKNDSLRGNKDETDEKSIMERIYVRNGKNWDISAMGYEIILFEIFFDFLIGEIKKFEIANEKIFNARFGISKALSVIQEEFEIKFSLFSDDENGKNGLYGILEGLNNMNQNKFDCSYSLFDYYEKTSSSLRNGYEWGAYFIFTSNDEETKELVREARRRNHKYFSGLFKKHWGLKK